METGALELCKETELRKLANYFNFCKRARPMAVYMMK